MMRWKRLFYYLLINVVVSATTTFVVLSYWERTHQQEAPVELEAVAQSLPTQSSSLAQEQPEGTDSEQPSMESTENILTYKVKPGETLGEIAEAFDVTLAMLLEYNGFSDVNEIGAGQVILIPAPMVVTPLATSSAAMLGTPIPTVTQSQAVGEAQVTIVSVIGAGDLESERVLLRGTGGEELTLTQWQLQDLEGNAYVFPQITLYKDGAVNVYTKVGMDTVVDLFWGMLEPVWDVGDVVTLLDPQGEVRATYQVP